MAARQATPRRRARRARRSGRAAVLACAALAAAAVAARIAVELAERPAQRVAGADPEVARGGGAPGLLERAGRRGAGPAGSSHVAPPSWEPRPLTALAGWVPGRPATPAGRAAGYLWAAPLTCAGLLAGATSRARPRLRGGALLFSPARGPAGLLLRARGFGAMAVGHVILARRAPSPALLAHELVHVRQAERLGPLLAPLYVALAAVYGYARHPLERAARLGQRRAAAAGRG